MSGLGGSAVEHLALNLDGRLCAATLAAVRAQLSAPTSSTAPSLRPNDSAPAGDRGAAHQIDGWGGIVFAIQVLSEHETRAFCSLTLIKRELDKGCG